MDAQQPDERNIVALPPLKVFISYAHQDKSLLKQLETHLSLMRRQGLIRDWHDRKIEAGIDWAEMIDMHLEEADIILLLISANFLASDYCYGIELKRAMQRHEAKQARVVPIVLRPVDWISAPFARLQALPSNGKAITLWKNRDEAFVDVASGLRRTIEKISEQQHFPQSDRVVPSPPWSQQMASVEQHPKQIETTRQKHSLPHQGQKPRSRVIWVSCVALVLLLVAFLFSPFSPIKPYHGQTQQPTATRMLPSPVGIFQEFSIPTEGSAPSSITSGSDGNLWFTESKVNKIGRITSQGHITEYLIPTPNSVTGQIVSGSDGNFWFYENNGDKIGRITPKGHITEFPVTAGSNLVGITSGPDGNLWFTEEGTNKIGRMTTSGVVTGEFVIPTPNSHSETITNGPDGNVWFVEDVGNKLGRITPQGSITEFPIPIPLVPHQQNYHGLTKGPDGNLWLTAGLANMVARLIPPQGDVKEYPVLLPDNYLGSVCAGPDGNLWFTDKANYIARMNPSGVFTDFFRIPTSGSRPDAITVGPDKNIWFTEYNGNKIGQITTGF